MKNVIGAFSVAGNGVSYMFQKILYLLLSIYSVLYSIIEFVFMVVSKISVPVVFYGMLIYISYGRIYGGSGNMITSPINMMLDTDMELKYKAIAIILSIIVAFLIGFILKKAFSIILSILISLCVKKKDIKNAMIKTERNIENSKIVARYGSLENQMKILSNDYKNDQGYIRR